MTNHINSKTIFQYLIYQNIVNNSISNCRIILQQKFLPAAHEDLLAAFRTLDPENTGQIDKEVITQIFTEEGEAFSQVYKI